MYYVVTRNIAKGVSEGVLTWKRFDSQEGFKEWYDQKMRSWYEVVALDVTPEEAVEICSSPEAKIAAILSDIRKMGEQLQRISRQ